MQTYFMVSGSQLTPALRTSFGEAQFPLGTARRGPRLQARTIVGHLNLETKSPRAHPGVQKAKLCHHRNKRSPLTGFLSKSSESFAVVRSIRLRVSIHRGCSSYAKRLALDTDSTGFDAAPHLSFRNLVWSVQKWLPIADRESRSIQRQRIRRVAPFAPPRSNHGRRDL